MAAILPPDSMSTADALTWFDSLPAVDLASMAGRWRGSGLATNHPLDGLLEAAHWYGKEIIDAETVHPLLFLDGQNQPFKVSPAAIPPPLMAGLLGLLGQPLGRSALQPILRPALVLAKTESSQARLRLVEHRQVLTATLIYDYLPICDHFRRVDDQTVLGLMDYKALPQPFFFTLRRERD